MANKTKKPTSDFPKTMKQLGLVAPDTEFNRRAADYAKKAVHLAQAKASQARAKERRNNS